MRKKQKKQRSLHSTGRVYISTVATERFWDLSWFGLGFALLSSYAFSSLHFALNIPPPEVVVEKLGSNLALRYLSSTTRRTDYCGTRIVRFFLCER